MVVDVQLYEGRSLDVVTQVETLAPYAAGIVGDYRRYTAGTAMLETAERLTDEEREPAVQQFLLLVGGLRRSPKAARPGAWCSTPTCCGRWPSPAGRRASTTARGAVRPGPHRAFSVAGRRRGVPRLPPTGLGLARRRRRWPWLAALLSGDWEAADASEPRHRREGSGLVAAFLQWHLERGLRSLPLVERA